MNKLIGVDTKSSQKVIIECSSAEHISDVIDNFIIPMLLGLGYSPYSIEKYIRSSMGSFYDGWEMTEAHKEMMNSTGNW